MGFPLFEASDLEQVLVKTFFISAMFYLHYQFSFYVVNLIYFVLFTFLLIHDHLLEEMQGGKSTRIVNCVLALKSYGEWKQVGGNGSWKYGGNLKPGSSGKCSMRRNSEPFVNSLSRNQSMDEKFQELEHNIHGESNEMVSKPKLFMCCWLIQFIHSKNSLNLALQTTSNSLNMLVHEVLSDKKPDEIPLVSIQASLNQ